MSTQTDNRTAEARADSLQRLVSTRYQFKTDFENHNISSVTFDRMRSPFYQGERWAVRQNSSCLSKDGEWEYEHRPSSRDDEFYARCRFDSLDEALAAVERANGDYPTGTS
jgi:hypothetical protein